MQKNTIISLLNIWKKNTLRGLIEKTKNGWHLANFPVLQPDKSTTKVRTVFDVSARLNKKSINYPSRSKVGARSCKYALTVQKKPSYVGL